MLLSRPAGDGGRSQSVLLAIILGGLADSAAYTGDDRNCNIVPGNFHSEIFLEIAKFSKIYFTYVAVNIGS